LYDRRRFSRPEIIRSKRGDRQQALQLTGRPIDPRTVLRPRAQAVRQPSRASACRARRQILNGRLFQHFVRIWLRNPKGHLALSQRAEQLEDEIMKLVMALAAAAGIALAIPSAQADETRVGVGVGPVGAGVTVGESHERDRTTVIRREREDEPRDRTTIIRKEREEPDHKVIIKEHDRD
jgi:hypothetical protein